MAFVYCEHCEDCGRRIGFEKFKAQKGKCDSCKKEYCECGQSLSQFEKEELESQCQVCYNKGIQQKADETRHPDDKVMMYPGR